MDKLAENYIPLTKIQKIISKRMVNSKHNKACFYIEAKADITELMAMRPKLKKSLGVKITTNVFYIRALALAVKQLPLMVGTIQANNIKIADSINVGFAVNAPHGLIVPVIKNADRKTLAQIAKLEKQLTELARSNKLTLEQIEDETIALSNLGAYGIDSFLGIIPPPTSTIVAVGNAIRQPIPKSGNIAIRKMATISLAADHRVVDPPYAAHFLNLFIEKLQNPQQLT